ncbi:hypothetical protein AX16_004695 [Volvariella volvacea WC 439]|nr:hypothetical protein AX16_004695 [Volvariella volvacea WC 439]
MIGAPAEDDDLEPIPELVSKNSTTNLPDDFPLVTATGPVSHITSDAIGIYFLGRSLYVSAPISRTHCRRRDQHISAHGSLWTTVVLPYNQGLPHGSLSSFSDLKVTHSL